MNVRTSLPILKATLCISHHESRTISLFEQRISLCRFETLQYIQSLNSDYFKQFLIKIEACKSEENLTSIS